MMLLACSLQASSTRPVWYTNIFATEMTLLPPWGELLLLQLCMTKSENDSQFRSNVKDSSLLSRVVLTVWGVVTLICGAFIFGQSTTIAVMQLIRKTWVHGPEGERETVLVWSQRQVVNEPTTFPSLFGSSFSDRLFWKAQSQKFLSLSVRRLQHYTCSRRWRNSETQAVDIFTRIYIFCRNLHICH